MPQRNYSQNLYIEASAGTGKTYTIVEIVSELLQMGTSLTEIVVVTFTEKAAGELKDRIRKKLEILLYENSDTNNQFLQARKDIAFSSIGTIHQFCRSILSKNALEIGLSPDYQELTDLGSVQWEIFYRFFSKLENEFVQSGRKEELITFLMEISIEELQLICFEAIEKTGGKEIQTFDLETMQKDLQKNSTLLWNLLQGTFLLEKFPEEMQNLRECLTKSLDIEILQTLLTEKPFTAKATLNKTNIGKKIDENTQENINTKASQAFALAKDIQSAQTIGLLLIEILNKFINHYNEFCKEHNFLTTNEIIQETRDALQSKPRIKLENWKYLIIDECQDTDPVQFDLFGYLQNKIPTMKIIMVGDTKQSIYKFRNADLASLQDFLKKQKFLNDEALNISYRSSLTLVDSLNLLFTKIPSLQYKPIQVDPNRKKNQSFYSPFLYTKYSGEEKANKAVAEEFAASSIVQCIQNIVQNPEFTTLEKKESNGKMEFVPREIQYSDIAIFSSSRENLRTLLSYCKKAKIPAGIYKEETFFESPIVASLSYLLHALENPLDSASLYKALVSNLFLIDNAAITRLFPNGDISYLKPIPFLQEEFSELKKIFKSLAIAHSERYQHSASFLIQRVLEEQEILPRLSSGFEGKRNLTNVFHFLEILNQKQFGSNLSFGSLAREIRQSVENGVKEKEKIDFDEFSPEENAVKLMTIHASKGLEFPVCMFFGFAGGANNKSPICLVGEKSKTLSEKKIELQIRIKDFNTPGWEKAKKENSNALKEETDRLFYVALTRAKDYIFFPIVTLEGKSKSNLNEIIDQLFYSEKSILNELEKKQLAFSMENYKRPESKKEKKEKVSSSSIIDIQELYKKTEKKIQGEKAYKKVISYSSLHSKQEIVQEKPKTKTEFQDGSEGAEFGKVCHAVLEKISLNSFLRPDEFKEEIELICKKEFNNSALSGVSARYNLQSIIEFSNQAICSIYPTSPPSTPKDWKYITRERKFFEKGESVGDFLLGIGDLFFFHADKYYILDWKSDILTEEAVKNLEQITLEKYRYQIFIYSWCILKNLANGKNLSIEELERIYSEKFGGMLYVFLRELQSEKGSLIIKPDWEELCNFIFKFREEKLA